MSISGDYPLYAHCCAQKRFGAILREYFSLEANDRVRVCNAKSHLYTLIQKNQYSLILGSGEECGRVSEFFLQNFGGGNIKESEYFPQLYSNC